MIARSNGSPIAGLALHVFVGGLLIFTGLEKVVAPIAPEALVKYGLGGEARLIGAGAVLGALLLLFPQTSSLGVLLTSAFWGGTICIHMAHGEPYGFQALLLVLTWAGAYLRTPATLSRFSRPSIRDVGRDSRVKAARAVTGARIEHRPDVRHFEHGAGI